MRQIKTDDICKIRIEIESRDLKLCPFCGAVARVERRGSGVEEEVQIACSNKKCGMAPATRWQKLLTSDGRRAPNVQGNLKRHWNTRNNAWERDYDRVEQRSRAAKRFLAEVGG